MNRQNAIGTTDIADSTDYDISDSIDAFSRKGNHNAVGYASEPIGYPCHPDIRGQLTASSRFTGVTLRIPFQGFRSGTASCPQTGSAS